MKHRILLVDDHQLVLDGIAGMLAGEADLQVVGMANNGQEALKQAEILGPDLILMDMDMPILNGMEAARQLLEKDPQCRIAILTMHQEASLVQRMMQMGVQGYFLKNADKSAFLQGIRMILSGNRFFQAEALMGAASAPRQLVVSHDSAVLLAQLSPREQEILRHIAMGKTSAAIAEVLHISTRTVETHRKNIHQKLDIRTLAGLIRFAIKSGLVD